MLLFLCVQGYTAELPRDVHRAGYIALPKDKPIDNATYLYVKYALASFVEDKVSVVLLDLDTPGGEVFAAMRIASELHKIDVEHHIPVIAFVDNWALSAGALLAYSCRFIGTTWQGSMGAAEPVIVSGSTMETASEKMVSALRTEFAKTAKIYDRNPFLAEAMCDKDLLLVKRQGKVIGLAGESLMQQGDLLIKAQGKLLTVDAEQMQAWQIADFVTTSGGVEPLMGQEIFSKEFFPDVVWHTYTNWKISFFAFLSHPMISSLLVMGVMLGIYGTVQGQMLGMSTLIGLIALGFLLLSTFATEVIGVLEIIMLVIGLGMIFVDFCMIGVGFLGGIGILLLLGGLFALLLPSLQGFSFDFTNTSIVFEEWLYRLTMLLGSIILAVITMFVFGRLFGRHKIFQQRLILSKTISEVRSEKVFPEKGSIGEALSDLRPQGKIRLQEEIYEVTTEGEFLPRGTVVEVVDHHMQMLIVRKKV